MRQLSLLIALAALLAAPAIYAADDTDTSAMGVTVVAEATIDAAATTTLSKGGTEFESYTGDTTFTYSLRTTASGGTGSIKVALDHILTNVANDTIALGELTLGCTVADSTSPCEAGTAASITAPGSTVAGFGADKHVTDGGGTITWTLHDHPDYKTGAYHAVATITVSAA